MRVYGFMNSYHDGIAGGDRWAIEVFKRLQNRLNIIVITSKRGKRECLRYGLTDVDFRITTHEDTPGNIYRLYLRRSASVLALDIDPDEDDILFATSIFLPDVLPLLYYSGRKTAIYHMKTPAPISDYKSLLSGRSYRKFGSNLTGRSVNWAVEQAVMPLLCTLCDVLFVLPTTRKPAGRYGFTDDQLHTTVNGIDRPDILDGKTTADTYDACWIGRVHPQKGIDDLFRIWSSVVDRRPDATLAVMGKNSESLENEVKARGLDGNVSLLGYVSEAEKYEVMRSSRGFLFPSRYESFGIAIIEAAASGLPVFAYDLPEYEVIYGKRLNTAPIGDSRGLADEFTRKVLEDSPSKPRKLSEEFLEAFTWNRIARDFHRVIQDVQ